ncbi:MAG TPA: MATE family efflux transporter [Polyangia bacterium]|jgi:MATE family multidrug resistance protein
MDTEPKKLEWETRKLPELLRLAWPITVSTLSYSIMTLVDTLLVGHLGPASLAGVGMGGTAAFAVLCFSFGMIRGIKTLVSQAVGAGRGDLVQAYRSAALQAALVLGAATIVAGQLIAPLMLHVSATRAAGEATQLYFWIRNLAAPLALVGVALRETRYGEGDARSPMVATIVGNAVNIALATTFVYRLKWGVAGAASATVIAQGVESGVLWWMGRVRGWRAAGATRVHFVELWRIGLPTALQFMLEVGSFVLLAALISSLSETQMAAHQIALQVCQFSFLPAYAVSEAASVLAGQAVGARRQELVLPVAHLCLRVGGAYTLACSFVFVACGRMIASGFTSDPTLAAYAVRLLYVAAVFQTFDGANIAARCILRGVGDVRFAAVVGVVTAWLMTPPLAWLLGWRAGLGAFGGWLGLCGECIIGALVLWHRLQRGKWRDAAEATRPTEEPALVAISGT